MILASSTSASVALDVVVDGSVSQSPLSITVSRLASYWKSTHFLWTIVSCVKQITMGYTREFTVLFVLLSTVWAAPGEKTSEDFEFVEVRFGWNSV